MYPTSLFGCLQKLQFNESQTEIIIFTPSVLLPASPISVIGTIIQQSDAEIRAHPPLLLFLPLIIQLVFQSCRIYLLSMPLHSPGHQPGLGIITISAPEAGDVCSNWVLAPPVTPIHPSLPGIFYMGKCDLIALYKTMKWFLPTLRVNCRPLYVTLMELLFNSLSKSCLFVQLLGFCSAPPSPSLEYPFSSSNDLFLIYQSSLLL